jgi:NADP-dependent 3-hydroxy acid dehydrogenase YdfG
MTQVVVVTGASGGVGRAIAHAFAKRGARLGLLARGRESLEAAAAEVRALGGEALVLPTDVADADQVEAAAAAVDEHFGPIDVWVNDAMATVFARFRDTEPAEYKRATEVTYLGTVYGTMAALRRMHARDRGVIVQVGSALSYRAIPLQASYCGAKFAIRGFTDSLRTELLADHSNVRLTMVQLPGVNTTQFNWCRSKLPKHPQPVPPIYQPEIPAEAVYWAAQHPRRELWVGYSTIQAIVGNKLSPWLADRYLARKAIDGQQVQDMPVPGDRPDNLYDPLPELAATHGIFDSQAKTRSPQLWANTHRPLVAGVLTAAGLALARRRR